MNAAKLLVAATWIASIVAWFMPWEGIGAMVLRAIAPFFTVAHIVEFFVYREVFEKAGGASFGHFLQTFVFGVVHINAVKEETGQSDAA